MSRRRRSRTADKENRDATPRGAGQAKRQARRQPLRARGNASPASLMASLSLDAQPPKPARANAWNTGRLSASLRQAAAPAPPAPPSAPPETPQRPPPAPPERSPDLDAALTQIYAATETILQEHQRVHNERVAIQWAAGQWGGEQRGEL